MVKQEKSYCTSLYEIAAAMNSAGNPGELLNGVVKELTKALDVKGCSLLLLTPDRKLLLHTASYGLSEAYIRKGPVFVGTGYEEAKEGRSVVIENATTDERFQFREEAKGEGIASLFMVPVTLRDELVGLMVVYSAKKRRFTQDDLDFAIAVANLGAIALANARLYDSLMNDNERLRLEIAEWRADFPLIREQG